MVNYTYADVFAFARWQHIWRPQLLGQLQLRKMTKKLYVGSISTVLYIVTIIIET